MKNSKRFLKSGLSFVLTLCMIVILMPVFVMAEGDEDADFAVENRTEEAGEVIAQSESQDEVTADDSFEILQEEKDSSEEKIIFDDDEDPAFEIPSYNAGTIAPAADAEIKYSGTHGTCIWEIYDDGTLIVQPAEGEEGVFPSTYDSEKNQYHAPWYDCLEKTWSSFKMTRAAFRGTIHGEGRLDNLFESTSGCELYDVDLSGLETSAVTSMAGMFDGCIYLTSLDVSGFDTKNVTDMCDMFNACTHLTSLDLSNFDTSQVTSMKRMFLLCQALPSLDLRSFETGNVTTMVGMFGRCTALKSIKLNGFDTKSVTDMTAMFSECESLTALDLTSFNTENVTSMKSMFQECTSLKKLDLQSFNTAKAENMIWMFDDCTNLEVLITNFEYGVQMIKNRQYPQFPVGMIEITDGELNAYEEGDYIPKGLHIFSSHGYVDPKTSDYFVLGRDNNSFPHMGYTFFNFSDFVFRKNCSLSDLLKNNNEKVVIDRWKYDYMAAKTFFKDRKIVKTSEINLNNEEGDLGYTKVKDPHGLTGYTAYSKEAVKGENFWNRSSMITAMNRKWEGSCFGLCYTAILYSEGRLSEFFGNRTFYSLGWPRDTKTPLRDVINYYHLLAHRTDFNPDFSTGKKSFGNCKVSLSEFLEKFVAEAQYSKEVKEPFLFEYIKKNDGAHTVIACGYYFDEDTSEHVVIIADLNNREHYKEFRVADDYQSFSYIYKVTENEKDHSLIYHDMRDDYKNMSFHGVDTLAIFPTIASSLTRKTGARGLSAAAYEAEDSSEGIFPGNASDEDGVVNGAMADADSEVPQDTVILSLSAFEKCTVINAEGRTLICDGEDYSGDMEVYDDRIVGEKHPDIEFTVDASDSFTITGLDTTDEFSAAVQIGDGYYQAAATAGSMLFTASGVKLDSAEGEEYTYSVTQAKEAEEIKLVSVEGSTEGALEASLEDTLTINLENAAEYTNVTIFTEDDDQTILIEDNIDELTVEISGDTPEVTDKNIVVKDINDYPIFDIEELTYTGDALQPEITLGDGYKTLIAGTDYDIEYTDINGNEILSLTNAGLYNATVTGKGNYTGTITKSFVVKRVEVEIPTGRTLTYNGKERTGVAAGDAYMISGNTGTNAKTYMATLALKDQDNYLWSDGTTENQTVSWRIKAKAITPAVTLSATAYTYNGKVRKPSVTVKNGSTKLSSANYTVTYASGRKNVGAYKVTVKMKGNYSGSKTVSFKINPKGTSVISLTPASKAITVKWTKQAAKMASSRITGYQIQLATDSKFTKNEKTVTVSGYSKVSAKVTALKGGKKYYVHIRTFKTVSGKKYYSSWSKAKTVTTKK